jgi:hypothetical protein
MLRAGFKPKARSNYSQYQSKTTMIQNVPRNFRFKMNDIKNLTEPNTLPSVVKWDDVIKHLKNFYIVNPLNCTPVQALSKKIIQSLEEIENLKAPDNLPFVVKWSDVISVLKNIYLYQPWDQMPSDAISKGIMKDLENKLGKLQEPESLPADVMWSDVINILKIVYMSNHRSNSTPVQKLSKEIVQSLEIKMKQIAALEEPKNLPKGVIWTDVIRNLKSFYKSNPWDSKSVQELAKEIRQIFEISNAPTPTIEQWMVRSALLRNIQGQNGAIQVFFSQHCAEEVEKEASLLEKCLNDLNGNIKDFFSQKKGIVVCDLGCSDLGIEMVVKYEGANLWEITGSSHMYFANPKKGWYKLGEHGEKEEGFSSEEVTNALDDLRDKSMVSNMSGKDLLNEIVNMLSEKRAAAVSIQAVVRGILVRVQVSEKRAAAVRIKAVDRG